MDHLDLTNGTPSSIIKSCSRQAYCTIHLNTQTSNVKVPSTSNPIPKIHRTIDPTKTQHTHTATQTHATAMRLASPTNRRSRSAGLPRTSDSQTPYQCQYWGDASPSALTTRSVGRHGAIPSAPPLTSARSNLQDAMLVQPDAAACHGASVRVSSPLHPLARHVHDARPHTRYTLVWARPDDTTGVTAHFAHGVATLMDAQSRRAHEPRHVRLSPHPTVKPHREAPPTNRSSPARHAFREIHACSMDGTPRPPTWRPFTWRVENAGSRAEKWGDLQAQPKMPPGVDGMFGSCRRMRWPDMPIAAMSSLPPLGPPPAA